MKCLNCGEELKEGTEFCTNCGVMVQESSANNVMEASVNENSVNSNNVVGPSVKPIDETNINNQNMVNNMNMNNTNTNITNNIDNKVVKKRNKTPLIIISCIILLGVIACLLYLFVFNKKSSKQIFVDGFKSATSELFKDDNSSKKSIKNNMSFNIQANGTGIDNMFDAYNNIKVSSDIEIDASSNKLDEEILINYKGNNLLGFGIYGRNDSVYLELTGMYDKYIKLPITKEQYNSLFVTDNKSMNEIKEALDTAFEASLDNKYFTKSSKSIDVNGKSKKYNAYTLTITNDNIKDIVKNFVNNLLSNDKFATVLSSNLKVDKSMVKELAGTTNYSNIYLASPIEITIYTSGLKETYKGIEFKTSESGNQYALRYIKIDNNNSELVFDAGITSLKFTINESGSDNNKKTTISTDLGIVKADLVTDSIISNTVNFKDIDTTNVVEYEQFINNSDDILNNALENNKALTDFITEISGKMNVSNNNLDYGLTY